TAPVPLDGDWNADPPDNGAAYGPTGPTHPPIAASPGTQTAPLQPTVMGNATLTATVVLPAYFQPVPISGCVDGKKGKDKDGKNCDGNNGNGHDGKGGKGGKGVSFTIQC